MNVLIIEYFTGMNAFLAKTFINHLSNCGIADRGYDYRTIIVVKEICLFRNLRLSMTGSRNTHNDRL